MDKKVKDRAFCRFCLDISIIIYLIIIYFICKYLDFSSIVTFGLIIDCFAIDMLLRYKKSFSFVILILIGVFYLLYNKYHLNIQKPSMKNLMILHNKLDNYISKEGI